MLICASRLNRYISCKEFYYVTLTKLADGSPSSKIASMGEDDLERLMRIADAEKQAEKDLAASLESRSESETVSQG